MAAPTATVAAPTARKETSIGNLPEEVLGIVFDKVQQTEVNSTLRCMEVCRLWCRMVPQCMTSLTVRQARRGFHSLPRVATFKFLTTLKIVGRKEYSPSFARGIKAIGKGCKQLSDLSVTKVVLDRDQIAAIAKYCPGLVTLSIALTKKAIPPKRTVTALPSLDNLKLLKSLTLDNFDEMETVPSLANLTDLEHLEFGPCSVSEVPLLKSLPKLQYFRIHSEHVEKLSVVGLNSLRELHLFGCMGIQKINGLEALPQLTSLTLCMYDSMDVKPKFELMPHLTRLFVGFGSADALQNFLILPSVKKVELTLWEDCEEESLEALANVEELSLNLQDAGPLPIMEPLGSLRSLQMEGLGQVEDFDRLADVPHIEKLHFHGPFVPETVPDLAHLTNLKELRFTDCASLTHISPISPLMRLEELLFDSCADLEELPELISLVSLRILTVTKCPALVDVPPLPSSLCVMRVTENEVKRLPSLDETVLLQEINLKGNMKLVRMPSLSNLPRLRSLNLEGCNSLTDMLKELEMNPAADVEIKGVPRS